MCDDLREYSKPRNYKNKYGNMDIRFCEVVLFFSSGKQSGNSKGSPGCLSNDNFSGGE